MLAGYWFHTGQAVVGNGKYPLVECWGYPGFITGLLFLFVVFLKLNLF